MYPLLQLFLDLLLETEAHFAVLLLNRFYQFPILIFLNHFFNILLLLLQNLRFHDVCHWHDYREVKAHHAHFCRLLLLVHQFHVLFGFLVGALAFFSLRPFFNEASYPVKLSFLLFYGVRELKDIGEVLELYLAIEDELRLPNQVFQSLVRLNNLFPAESLLKLFNSQKRLTFRNSIKELPKVLFHLITVALQFTIDEFFVVEEDLS